MISYTVGVAYSKGNGKTKASLVGTDRSTCQEVFRFQAADHDHAIEALQSIVRPGDPRPVQGRTNIACFADDMANRPRKYRY